MIRRFALASAIFIAVGSAAPAMAGTATDDLTVSSYVVNNCAIFVDDIGFGAYDPIVANGNSNSSLNATGSVTTICTSGASATITLGQGSNGGTGSTNAFPLRRLNDGGNNYLNYYLYQNQVMSTVWGNTPDTGVSVNGNGLDQTIIVYGRISGGQNVPAGSYSDTVVATVTF
ncbi:spore coat U domain-containing protein [Dolichospermum circinale CS-534/05]|uniref:Csu type fimbrial protein n=1 Tax=Dolichospermum circinale TaxID=109265 RepID=UPI00232B299A|nr:spore coat U domain-containing protein [Dolichospermum circinale]MDB9490496.1 spore coat U domain-containing protein [Dolichospermum circinale CS-534/05]